MLSIGMKRVVVVSSVVTGLALTGLLAIQAQEPVQNQRAEGASTTNHSDCLMFGAERERYANQALKSLRLGQLTSQVSSMRAASMGTATAASMPSAPGGSRTSSTDATGTNLIDPYIFNALKAQGVTPARMTTDYEFVRRIYLDMIGQIPTPAVVNNFVASTSPTKRADLIETLFAAPQWLDKWTMYFGDQFKSASSFPSTGTNIYSGGRDGLDTYIRNFLANDTPYNQVATALIASQGTNNYTQGELNWIITSRVTGGPNQDVWDGEAAAVAETFLGLSHVNCLLCHDGRGHLDSISLWAGGFTRYQAWGMSSFYSHIALEAPAVTAGVSTPTYWYANDAGYKTDYALNTTTGNRPARQPVAGHTTVPPTYPFSGQGALNGLNYRQSLASQVIADRQFARAAVNYMWAYFFGMGIVDPPDQFDPDRLDPNNPPPAPWTLQPSNPQLLEALTSDFIASGYSTKHLMRTIVNSQAYQLSSDYDPTVWNVAWQPLFARKLVRRLWGEEVADSISISANISNKFTFDNGTVSAWAMQYPEPAKETSTLLAAFLPGDRDTNPRKQDGAIQQALALMNDSQVMNKLVSTGTGPTQSLLSLATASTNNAAATNLLFINILSRYPTAAELASANTFLSTGTRSQKMQELMWTLYNKVDFIFNY
jgi:hypothetical protein